MENTQNVAALDSTPAITADATTPDSSLTTTPQSTTEPIDKPLHEHPRFKEVIAEKNAAQQEAEQARLEAKQLKEQLESFSKQGGEQDAFNLSNLSAEEKSLFNKIYPNIREAIFTEAQKAEQARLEQLEQEKQANEAQLEKQTQEDQVIINEVRERLSNDDAEIKKFSDFATKFSEKFPEVTDLRKILADYEERGLLTKSTTPSKISTGNSGKAEAGVRPKITDPYAAARDHAKELGMFD
jgi:hypothetical protein